MANKWFEKFEQILKKKSFTFGSSGREKTKNIFNKSLAGLI